jgi:PX domain
MANLMHEEQSGVPPQEELSIVTVQIVKGEPNVDGTVFYTISVTGSFNSWAVSKRYSQFVGLNDALVAALGNALPRSAHLPPKKINLFGSHTTKAFIEERL